MDPWIKPLVYRFRFFSKLLLPGLPQVDDVNSIHRATEDVALHAVVHVASSQVGLADLGLAKAKKKWGL
jgi:hypothetical protein